MLKAIASYDGERDAIGVEDTDGGVWWPDPEAQSELQAAVDPKAAAVRMCAEAPSRGSWST